jgi:large subunit ribosomal protein L15
MIKKVTKQRGNRTHGWGSQKKHRGGGSRGGKGRGGISKHKRLMFRKKDENLGKRGFKSLQQRGIRKSQNAISIRDVEKLAGDKKVINLLDHGYERVLGTGEIKKALEVKAKHFSAKAKDKITNAGGKVIVDGEEKAKDT